jgi:hypothetical protein
MMDLRSRADSVRRSKIITATETLSLLTELNRNELLPHLTENLGFTSKSHLVDSVLFFNESVDEIVRTGGKHTITLFVDYVESFLSRVVNQVFSSSLSAEELVGIGNVQKMFTANKSYIEEIGLRLGSPDLFGPAVDFFRAKKTDLTGVDPAVVLMHELTRAMYAVKKRSKLEEECDDDHDEEDNVKSNSKLTVPLDYLMEKFPQNDELAAGLAALEFLGIVKQPGLREIVQSSGKTSAIRIRKCYTDTALVDMDEKKGKK